MKFKELLNQFKDEEIIKRLFELYPDQKENKKGYKLALEELRVKKSKESDFIIDAKKYDVSGINIKSGEIWAIEYVPWAVWLGSDIKRGGLNSLCNCLWEMTWSGYSDREIQKDWKKILKDTDDAIKQIKNK